MLFDTAYSRLLLISSGENFLFSLPFLKTLPNELAIIVDLSPKFAVILSIDVLDKHVYGFVITCFGKSKHFCEKPKRETHKFRFMMKRDQPSKVVAGVSNDNKPHKVPPPRLVPLTRSKVPSSSTLMIETPDPMLTNVSTAAAVSGFPSNVTSIFRWGGTWSFERCRRR